MARKIIIKEQIKESSDLSLNYVFWANVPAGREILYSDPAATSSVKDITAPELAAIRAGSILEKTGTLNVTKASTIGQARTALQNLFNDFQTKVNADDTGKYYSIYWDGTTWIGGGLP